MSPRLFMMVYIIVALSTCSLVVLVTGPHLCAVHGRVHHCSLGHPPPVLWGLWLQVGGLEGGRECRHGCS